MVAESPSAAIARPLSVAIFGSSVTTLVTGARTPGELHLTYPAVLERTEIDGLTFSVSNYSKIYGLITDCGGIWVYPLAQTRPDVVIIQYGFVEMFPRIAPKVLLIHMLGLGRHTGPARRVYWALAHRARLGLSHLERTVDPHLPTMWARLSHRRFERELGHVCRQIHQQVGSRLVLMTSYPATLKVPYVTEHMRARAPVYNQAIERVAARYGGEVFPLDGIVEELDPEKSLPDGLHMTVDAHRVVGERLAEFLARPPVSA